MPHSEDPGRGADLAGSAARDSGSGRTEASMLTRHLGLLAGRARHPGPHRRPQVELTVFGRPVLADRLADTVRPALGGRAAFLVDQPSRTR